MRAGRGPAALASFLASLPSRAKIEPELVSLYHSRLTAAGVRDYTFDECLDDYRLGLLRRFIHPACILATVDPDSAQGRNILALLLGRSRELLDRVAQLTEYAHAMRSGEVGSLRVGGSPQVIQSVLAPFLARYLKRRPGVDVRLVEEGGVRTAALVERGEVHLALALRRGDDQLHGRLLFPVRVLVAVAPRHPLARRATIDVVDLQHERVLLLRQGFGARELFDAACRIAHVHPRTVLEAGDPRSLLALAETGRGVAIVPYRPVQRSKDLRGTPSARRCIPRYVGLDRLGNLRRFLTAHARSFIDGLVQHTSRNYPGREFERRAPPVPRPKE